MWEWLVLTAVGGFLLAYLRESLFPSREKPTWDYLPKYPLPPPDDDDEPK